MSAAQFYAIVRYFLKTEKSKMAKVKLVMQVMDELEKDYREVYPEEEPVIDGGFVQALLERFL